jgi:lactam utilization protein B
MQVAGIDLNADLGESFGVSANMACGFHAGDPAGLLRVAGWPPSAACVSERR